MYGADNRQQHIGIVFNVIQLKVVFVIIVSAFVAVQIVLQLGLQPAVGGLGPAQIGILGGIGGRADGPHHAVANRHRRGHTRLHEHQQQKTGKEQQHSHGMPLDKGHGPGRQLFRCDRRFLCGLGRLLCSLPRLLCVLPLDFLLLDIPGHRAALLHFRVGLHRGPVLIIRRSLDVPGLGLLHRFGRVLPDLLFYIPGCGAQGGLTDQLGSVGAFGADILMLHLIEFAMHIPMNGCTRRPSRLFYGAGLFRRFLLCQLFLGLIQLFAPLFHTQLGLGGLLLLAFGSKLTFGGLWDFLSRSGPALIRPFAHGPYPPGV